MQGLVTSTRGAIGAATESHFAAFAETGIGNYFGYKSAYAKLSAAGKAEYLDERKKPGTTPPTPTVISCVNWVLLHLGEGYEAVGRGDVWQRILKTVDAADRDGTVLMQELKKDGWTSLYWNPDVKHPSDGNAEHPWTYHQVVAGKPYYGTPVDGLIVNYRPSSGSDTAPDLSGLKQLRNVPLWAGVANGGYHVFLGLGDQVNESHSTRNPDDITNVEQGPFMAFGTATSVKYNSGVILVPPGLWTGASAAPDSPSWIGDTCAPAAGCPFAADGQGATCHAFSTADGGAQGFCTISCEGYCPDQPGSADTFCIASPQDTSKGMCVVQTTSGDCSGLPGTISAERSRFVGRSGASAKVARVCVPPS